MIALSLSFFLILNKRSYLIFLEFENFMEWVGGGAFVNSMS